MDSKEWVLPACIHGIDLGGGVKVGGHSRFLDIMIFWKILLGEFKPNQGRAVQINRPYSWFPAKVPAKCPKNQFPNLFGQLSEVISVLFMEQQKPPRNFNVLVFGPKKQKMVENG